MENKIGETFKVNDENYGIYLEYRGIIFELKKIYDDIDRVLLISKDGLRPGTISFKDFEANFIKYEKIN